MISFNSGQTSFKSHITQVPFEFTHLWEVQQMAVTSVVLTPLTLVNKGQVNLRSVNGINEVNVTGSLQAPQT
jgi:hypothetical protein